MINLWAGSPPPAHFFSFCNRDLKTMDDIIIRNLPALAPQYNLPAPPGLWQEDIKRASDFAQQDKAASTRASYSSSFRLFEKFCRSRGVSSLPAAPETVAAFLAAEAEAGRKPSTIGRRCSAIGYAHKLAGHESPTASEAVKATVRGIRRAIGVAPNRKAPVLSEIARDMARNMPAGLKGVRDRALILVGFAGAFRRSELTSLNMDDIEFTDEGMRVTIRRSKTDGEGKGQTIAIVKGDTHCPIKALKAWIEAAGIHEGPLFLRILRGGHVCNTRLTPQTISILVKRYADALGLDGKAYSAHSLRSGFLSSAARRGASIWKMKEVSRHKSTDVLADYVRSVSLFENHAGSGLL
jgi:site-specific recombinase XerD